MEAYDSAVATNVAAGAPGEIEVTPAMIGAGKEVLPRYMIEGIILEVDREEVVRDVFLSTYREAIRDKYALTP